MNLTIKKQITKWSIFALLAVFPCVAGCSDDASEGWDALEGKPVVHKLTGFDTNSDFLAYAKKAATEYMRGQVELSRNEKVLSVSAKGRSTGSVDSFSSAAANDMDMSSSDADADADGIALDDAVTEKGSADKGGNADFSSTNIQEEGVDEADMVKTDGKYIYALYAGELIIVKVGDSGALTKAGTLDVGGYAKEMFIKGNSAVIFSNVSESDVPASIHYKYNPTPVNYPANDGGYVSDKDDRTVEVGGDKDTAVSVDSGDDGETQREPNSGSDIDADGDDDAPEAGGASDEPVKDTDIETPGEPSKPGQPEKNLKCGAWGCSGNTYVQIAVIDLSDKAAPELIRTTTYAGTYVTSRMVDGMVRAVIDSPLNTLQMVWDYGVNQSWSSEADLNVNYHNVINVNTKYFNKLTLDDIMPKKYDSEDGKASYIVNPKDIVAPQTPNGIGLQTVVSFNLSKPESAPSEAALFSQKGLVYASTTGLYLTSSRKYVSMAMESGLWVGGSSATTGIHKFDISSNVKNAKHMATGEVAGRLLNQFSMGEKNGYLRIAATTGNFWNGNKLDNHVYILKQSGKKLNITGQLDGLGGGEEIKSARFIGDRGFIVTFMNTDPLYTIDLSDPKNPKKIGEWVGPGFSTYLHPWGDDLIVSLGEENWQAAVSIFNVSNFKKPKLVDRMLFGDNYYSSALYEHKAFTFNPKTGYLALPYTGWGKDYETGIKTFTLTKDKIKEEKSLDFYTEKNASQETEAMRSLYIGDYMYGLSRCRLVSAPIDNPSAKAASLPLFDGAGCIEANY